MPHHAPAPVPHDPPPRSSVRRIRRLAAALADGGRPDLSELSLDDLRDIWRLVTLLDRLRDWHDEPQPESDPDAPSLTANECRAVLVDLGVPTAGQIVEDMLAEPLMQAALAGIGATVAALMPAPRRPCP